MSTSKSSERIAFFIDVDNTLINNDLLKTNIKACLVKTLGEHEAKQFWHHHDEFRNRKKLVDFPRIIRKYCAIKHPSTCTTTLDRIFRTLDFKSAVYSCVPEVLHHLRLLGTVSLFTEGDQKYQKLKVDKSGLSKRVDHVYLFTHKIDHLDEVVQKYAGSKLVFIDDRAKHLETIKKRHPTTFTIRVLQGHYAQDDTHGTHFNPDHAVSSIQKLQTLTADYFYNM